MHTSASHPPRFVGRPIHVLVIALLALAAILPVSVPADAEPPSPSAAAISPLTGVVRLESGYVHRCVIRVDDSVWCWGAGIYGVTGQGSMKSSLVPRKVDLPAGAVDLALGWFHSCAVLEDGTVWCWGMNGRNQLGFDGGSSSLSASPSPVQVPGVTGVTRVWAGPMSTCVATLSDKVRCWGGNEQSNLVPIAAQEILPTTMQGIAGVQDMALSASSTCVVLADDTVRCWGKDVGGALGDGPGPVKTLGSSDAVEAIGMTNVTGLAATAFVTCAVRSGKFATSTWCWGQNQFGDAGPSGLAAHYSPVKIPNLFVASTIVGNLTQMCIRTISGAALCWGSDVNSSGEATKSFGPTEVYPDDVAAVSRSAFGVCMLMDNNSVICQGGNVAGEAGGAPNAPDTDGNYVGLPSPSFVAADPVWLMDTRAGGATVDDMFEATGRVAAGKKVRVVVGGRPGVPQGGGTVMLQVRASGATKSGDLVVFPCAKKAPRAITLAFGRATRVSTTTAVKLVKGAICLRSTRAVHVGIELVGRQAPGAGLQGRRPSRLWNTRGETVDGAMEDTGLTPKATPTVVQVLGRSGLPTTAVKGVLLSITAGQGKAGGTYVAKACGQASSRAISGTYRKRGRASTFVVATTDAQGRICVTTSTRTHLTLDVVGIVTNDPGFTAGQNARVATTRQNDPTDTGQYSEVGKLPAGGGMQIGLLALDSFVPATSTPSATVVLTLTATSPAADGVVSVSHCAVDGSIRDTVLVRKGVTTTAVAVIAPGDLDSICVSSTVAVHVAVDISARFHW